MASIQVVESSKSPDGVWAFFDQIRDVNDISASEEQGRAWECHVGGELAGMIVVDTVPSYGAFINRVAVDSSYRRMGVASSLVQKVLSEYSRVQCRVHKDNKESQKLMESMGFVRDGIGRYDELITYIN